MEEEPQAGETGKLEGVVRGKGKERFMGPPSSDPAFGRATFPPVGEGLKGVKEDVK